MPGGAEEAKTHLNIVIEVGIYFSLENPPPITFAKGPEERFFLFFISIYFVWIWDGKVKETDKEDGIRYKMVRKVSHFKDSTFYTLILMAKPKKEGREKLRLGVSWGPEMKVLEGKGRRKGHPQDTQLLKIPLNP